MSYTRKQAIEELAIQLARVIDDLDLGVAENVLTEAVAERGWHIRTRLEFSDHPDDREPYVVTTLTIRRDETPTEREARYARQAARAAIAEWAMDPESGPPPEGVGFRDMLDQDTWWRPRDEEPLRIEDMSPGHRRRLLAFLERRATALKLGEELAYLNGPQPSGDAASDLFDAGMAELASTPAIEWLHEKPLVAKLRELVARDDKPLKRAARAILGTDDRRRG